MPFLILRHNMLNILINTIYRHILTCLDVLMKVISSNLPQHQTVLYRLFQQQRAEIAEMNEQSPVEITRPVLRALH